ncbi:methionine synthase [Phycisphaera mikurensis NBRC 102666]|uniref:Methionine synthase n=1 Tax=Phycisphaera mikurensis (strain NBRC 102666 / KCTC 22515 / FYK2301M01) TaxID=1142394 RepID=I0IEC8_PHYMF|nr:vitamin B12 dependent-methionine synthase activation domain-containing protein [Phycisphaera mikurensis]MBB6441416.1 5-methyltetrahydrofolate--homocysteine methyltransferase [Phycisphaera mikurensis]BAM03616.1 methionine synthase [Phycisphaera mikurensis NBRC 102666]
MNDDPLQAFIDLFPDGAEAVSAGEDLAELPLEERLRKHIVDGEKKHLDESLAEARGKYAPLDIVNDHLLDGMKTVGELFGSGKMQLPFVLQSATVMKAAVALLEPFMEKVEGQTKGTMLLATVRGDVHDIGKNLVDIILTNNGYTVHNIGIKVPVNELIAKYRETRPDAIGLSGLLVKSVNVMEENLKELNAQNIDVPMILGGAALQRSYCEGHLRNTYNGSTFHGTDAFEGLRLMDMLCGGRIDELNAEIDGRAAAGIEREAKVAELRERADATRAARAEADEFGSAAVAERIRSDVAVLDEIPEPPFWGSRVVEGLGLRQIYPFVNEAALFKTQWMFVRGDKDSKAYERQLEEEVRPIMDRLKVELAPGGLTAGGVLQPGVVYGYYPVNSDGDDLVVFDAEDHDKEIERFTSFPRQPDRRRLHLADFFLDVGSGRRDVLALQCVTMGNDISRLAKERFDADDYQEYLYLHGMGVECAEALAELWHKRVRAELGIGNDDSAKIKQLFTQKYRGSRYSFGYPSCPEMQDQEILWRLLEPGRIGCELTENWQIDPEQSTSALIVHHPEAKYFNA